MAINLGGAVGGIFGGISKKKAAKKSAKALIKGAGKVRDIEQAAIPLSTTEQKRGNVAAGRETQAGLARSQAQLVAGQQGTTGTLQPFATAGRTAQERLTRTQALDVGQAGQFSPRTGAPLTFQRDPDSGLDFAVDPTSGERFQRDPDSGQVFAAETSSGQPFRVNDFDLQADPGFQFRLEQGQKALDRSAAARGGLVSGRSLNAASAFAGQQASEEFDKGFRRNERAFDRNADEFERGFRREGAAFDRNADEFQRGFGRDLAGTENRQEEFGREFGREGAGFDRATGEFSRGFGRAGDVFDRNAAANTESFQREGATFAVNEEAQIRRNDLRLQAQSQETAAVATSAGLGTGAARSLADLSAQFSTNLSRGEAAIGLSLAAQTLKQSELDSNRILASAASNANFEAVKANAKAGKAVAVGLANAQIAQAAGDTAQSVAGTVLAAFSLGG